MEKVSSYISKKVISLQDCENIGYVLDVVLDEEFTRCEGFIVVDEESENTFILQKKDVKAVGEDCLMIESADVLDVGITTQSSNPIGKPVYDKNGIMLGIVKDIIISSFHIKKLITSKCEIPLKFVAKVGKDCVMFGKKTQLKTKPDFNVKGKKLPTVYIDNGNIRDDKENIIKIHNDKKPFDVVAPEKPLRLFANTNSLIGKEVKSDIFGYNHEVIVRKYDKITQAVINKAKLHNKLNLLVFYSK